VRRRSDNEDLIGGMNALRSVHPNRSNQLGD
jgi:hypothetical protein